MIDCLIGFSIRNRTLVIAAGLVLALWGVYAVYHTPVDAIPDLSESQVVVFTEWMGHSPQEIEDQITYPLSMNLEGLAGVRVVRSSSDFNFSMINLIFEDSVDFYFARQQVAERLSRAHSLPPGVVPHLSPDAVATGQIFWYTVEGTGYDLGRLRAIQDWYVRGQLNSVPGVAEVASIGGHAIEYQIQVDPNLLRAYGVTLGALVEAVSRSNSAVGGHVIQKANAEYVVRAVGWIGAPSWDEDGPFDPQRAVRDIENIVVCAYDDTPLRLSQLASVSVAGQHRRGILEKDGSEVTGGVVSMRYGENPLEVTRRIRQKIQQLQAGLPAGVHIVPFYDRTPLIQGAIRTVAGTLTEAMVTATICVLIVLVHFRSSFIIAITLPLATLASFATMWTLRRLGIAEIQTNIMSLAGIAISIGVLVDSSIVMAENAMHHLKNQFGERRVRGDIRELVLPACRTVGRPIFFSVLIMLISFMPVFALRGIEGKMFHPLAFTKSFALLAAAVLAITLVPALCTIFIKGRLRHETESWLVRTFIEVYRPVLNYMLDRPAALVWFMAVTLIVGLAPLGNRFVFLAVLFLGLIASALATRRWFIRTGAMTSLVLIALIADQNIKPLAHEFMTPLDEGMVMDMPITVPRASVTESGDDLKARDMTLCRFPEVEMVVGKAGRADTAMDPAPLDMIETMVSFRPPELWPNRKLHRNDADDQGRAGLHALVEHGLIQSPDSRTAADSLVSEAVTAALAQFDVQMREVAYLKNDEFRNELGRRLISFTAEQTIRALEQAGQLQRKPGAGELTLITAPITADLSRRLEQAPALEDVATLAQHTAAELVRLGFMAPGGESVSYREPVWQRPITLVQELLGESSATGFTRLYDAVLAEHRSLWRGHVQRLNQELLNRAAPTYTRLVLDELLARGRVADEKLLAAVEQRKRLRSQATPQIRSPGHHGARSAALIPTADPVPALDSIRSDLARSFARRLLLWPVERLELIGFGGELDRALQVPGWTNVWTMPIQNRVDMLATGVNTAIGVRVLGRKLDDVVLASERIAAVVSRVSGAADVVADPIRGKGYLEIRPDRERAASYGVSVGDINDVVETALGGKVVTTTVEGRERHPVRICYARDWRQDEESVKDLLVSAGRAGIERRLGPERAGRSRQTLGPLLATLAASATGSAVAPSEAPGADADLPKLPLLVPLATVADVRLTEGPATIKTENGLLRNYVRLNVQGRGVVDFVEEARRTVATQIKLPEGVYVEWTGQFEHQLTARRTLVLVMPLVLGLIFLILYLTYHDLADAVLMMLTVPGAIAGGVFFQWLFGYRFSITVWVGYIACFGMATSTGIIMLVYLREAVAKAGDLATISLDQLRQAVMDGAVHRLRPKLLTEGTTILGLAPMLWATGPGAEVIRPMAAPVLGGILIADEVIDLFLPVLFYWVRRWRWMRLHDAANSSQTAQKPDPAALANRRLSVLGPYHVTGPLQTVNS